MKQYIVGFRGVCIGGFALVNANNPAEAKRKADAQLREHAWYGTRPIGRKDARIDLDVREVEFVGGVDVIWDGDY